jgi:LacI family transcriptional regulator
VVKKRPGGGARATIKDVARAARVAPSTVSKALCGKGHFSKETQARVLEAAERLGYRSSSQARGLRLQRSWSVGLLLVDITNPWFPEIVRGVEDALWAAGINLVLCNTDYRPDKEEAYLLQLLDRGVDGLILASTAAASEAVPNLQSQGVPLVMLNRRHRTAVTDYVGMDNAGGIAQAVAHLAALGHRRIGFMAGPSGSSAATERLEGFRAAMKKQLGASADSMIEQGDYSIASGFAAARKLLARGPTAIVSANDFMAYGAIDAILQAGLGVPRDVSLTGFDNNFVSALPAIGLSTVDPQTRMLGAEAARLILRRIADKKAPVESIILPTRLVIRHSTAPAKVQ